MIFDITDGYPHPVYNERVFCALGSGVGMGGSLLEEAVGTAATAIERLATVARAAGVRRLEAFATSAVRDASNGERLLAEIRSRTDCRVEIVGGEEEARLAAGAVVMGLQVRSGLVADLGGGSLELTRIRKGRLRDTASLPLGTLRLMAGSENDHDRMAREIADQLASVRWLGNRTDRTLFLVGGAWRAVARLRMSGNGHPLKIIHGYTISAGTARKTAGFLMRLDEAGSVGLGDDVSNRRATMPVTGLIMSQLIESLALRRVVFSGVGVREGYVCRRMAPGSVTDDPLLSGARGLARRESRFGDTTDTLMSWLAPLFPDDRAENRRAHAAVCALSDVAWREHPDHRARFVFERFLHHPFLGITHSERVFVAVALHVRYGGKRDDRAAYKQLLSRRSMRRAEILGHALHLAYRISAGNPELLGRSDLRVRKQRLSLRLPDDGSAPHISRYERSFRRLCQARQHRPGPITVRGRIVRAPAETG